MFQEKLSKLIECTVRETISKNKDFVCESISAGISQSDGWSECTSKMVINAVEISVRLSVQIMISLMLENGTLKFQEDSSGPQLTLIRGGVDSEPPISEHPE